MFSIPIKIGMNEVIVNSLHPHSKKLLPAPIASLQDLPFRIWKVPAKATLSSDCSTMTA